MKLHRLQALRVAVWMVLLSVVPIAQGADLLANQVERESLLLAEQPFEKFTAVRKGAPNLIFYVSKTPKPAPLLLYVQGSGCSAAFISMPGGEPASTIFSLVPTAKEQQYAVMVVDKPLVPAIRPANPAIATGCPKEFNDYFSFDTWLRDLKEAFRFARLLPWVDKRRSLILGISEGATMAAALAGSEQTITDVALIGASGPTQLYDFIAHAYRTGSSDAEILEELSAIEANRRRIDESPESSTKFVWGHTYRRWSSFFGTSSVDNLLRSDARVYLVAGMADENVPILSTEVLYAELVRAHKRVTMRRIPNAGHSLLPGGAKDYRQLNEEIRNILNWYGAE